MATKRSFLTAAILGIFSISLLAGCGAGGGGGASGSTSGGSTSTVSTVVSGSVVDGFVSGASVQAYKIAANGTKGDSIGSAATTGASGAYTLNLGTYTGPMLIEASGGSYTDWATGATVTLAPTDKLSAVVSNASGTVTAQLTPLTHMAAKRAQQDIAVNGTAAATAVTAANTSVGAYFGGFDILAVKPIDPTVAGSTSGASQNSIDYGLVLAGISQNADSKPTKLNPFSLVTAMALDAADGVYDGLQGALPIPVNNASGGGTTPLLTADTKTTLSTAITTFQNSAANTSGSRVNTSITQALGAATNQGTIFSQPDKPTGFAVSAVSRSQIRLTWTAPNGVNGYTIYRDGAKLKSVAKTKTEEVDVGLTANTQYCYAVSASDASGNESAQSVQLCAVTDITALEIPTGLSFGTITYSQIPLSWTASTGATGYRVYRDGQKLADVTTASYPDVKLAASTRYCYTVSAYDNSGNESGQTSQSCATTLSAPAAAPPATPTGFTGTALSQSQISLSWTAVTGVASYAVSRSDKPANPSTTSATSFVDTGLAANTTYCYNVTAIDSSGTASPQSAQVCVTTPTVPPPVPVGLTVTPGSTSQMTLTWSASAGATGYKIYRNGVLYRSATATTLADTGLAAGTTYCYMVSAFNATGSESAQGQQACGTTSTIPVPTGLTVVATSETQIDLSWSASTGALGYHIYKSGALLSASLGTSASDKGLTAGALYCYAVSAFDVSGNESVKSSTACAVTPPLPTPTSIELLVGSPQLNSDDATPVTLTALVKDSGNRAISGQIVTFTAGSGKLVVANGTTDAAGTATATIGTGGDPAKRTIALTAQTGTFTANNSVDVVGSTIDISGLSALSKGASTDLTITLKNSAGTGIAGKTVTVTSVNTLSAGPYVTNASGQATVRVTGSTAGADTITAAAIGVQKTFTLTVDPLVLAMTAPTTAKEITVGAAQPVSVTYTNNGNPVAGTTVNFLTTRGALTTATAVTDANGVATVNVSSTTTGPALVSAFVTGGPSVQTAVAFVATTPAKMNLQADPVIIGTNAAGSTTEKSLIKAVVRDAGNNLVKNKTINFTIASDASGGTLAPASAVTDSSGTATTYYIAGPSATGTDGVRIGASVADVPAVAATTSLTVSQKASFVSLATGPKITTLSDGLRYQQNYLALVTNTTGKPIEGAKVTATVTPLYYMKGYYKVSGSAWQQIYTLAPASSTKADIPACANEDGILNNSLYNYNGILDPGEDQNNNGRLDPGNIVSVTTTDTDANGFSTVSITYAKDYAYWVNVRLEVRVATEGDTANARVDFDLPGAAADFTDTKVQPPGAVSPFGVSTSCFDTKPDAPTGLTASAASATQVNLSWTASAGASGYRIYRGGALVKNTALAAVTDTGLTAGTQYCYQISAYDSTGSESAQSAQVCVTTPSLAAPTAPTVAAASPSQITFSWTGTAGAVSYKVYRDDTFRQSLTAPTVTYADTGLAAESSHCYKVSAVDAGGVESAMTGQVCATTPALASPANLTVAAASSSQINLSWTAVAGSAGYKIYKDGATMASQTVTAVTYADTGLAANSYHCYSISVVDGSNNESAKSGQLCVTTYGPPPATPTGLTASATSATRVDLAWTGSTGASQYKIYRNGVLLTATTATSYADTTAQANTAYAYTVTAIDTTGSESAATSLSTAHTGLTVPSGLTVTVNSSTEISLAWANSGGALVTGYKIYKNTVLLGSVTTTALVDGGLTPNTQYCYSVSATSSAGGESARSATVCGTTQPPPVPASVDLLVSSPQLNSDGASTVTLTAVVKDSANRALSGQAVSFTSDSGLLTVTQGTTGAAGTATATLGTGGDRSNREIKVSASAGGFTGSNTVTVTGTTLSISGAASMSYNDSTSLTIFLKDSSGVGIANQTLTVTSANGNTLSAASYKTDASGQVMVTVKAKVGGADKIRAEWPSGIQTIKEFDLTVNSKILAFTTPTSAKEIAIGAVQPVSVTYMDGAIPQTNVTVNFVATRGTLSSATAQTDVNGVATVNLSSTNSGPVLLQASVDSGPSAQVAAEFVATSVSTVTVQANPNTIGTNSGGLTTERSLITAVVRDANDNLVKNKTVNFSIVAGASNGTLSPASAITDSSGTASAYFIAGDSASAANGVKIRASVKDSLVYGDATLTVARKSLFITLATGPSIKVYDGNIRYQQDYVALVTDAVGNPVQGASVVATVTPLHYLKGYYVWPSGAARWQQVNTLLAASSTLSGIPACANEDSMLHNSLYDYNGVLDPGEDQNGNDRLDPGNVASVTATTTDATGHSTLSIVYAKDYAYWVNVKLEAFASLAGSTTSAFVTFYLPGLAADYSNQNAPPPGDPSPFGTSTTCFVDLTVTPVSSTAMTVTWQKSAAAASYNIYRGGVKVGSATQNTYSDAGLNGGTQYCYKIRTVNALGIESATDFTGQVCATTLPTPPATPTNFTATGKSAVVGTATVYSVDLTWTASAGTPAAAVYNIYRGSSTTPSLSATGTAVSDSGLTSKTAYCYTITAMDVAGNESAKSAPVCTATP